MMSKTPNYVKIKTGRVENVNNRIVFVADRQYYIIPFNLYEFSMLNKQITCEVNDFTKVVTKVI